MPKIVYANVVWLLIVMAGLVSNSISRHQSADWDEMPAVGMNYDVLFVGVFGCIFLASIGGLLRRKNWGYRITMLSNYLVMFLFLLPLPVGLVFSIRSNMPFSDIADIYWDLTVENLIPAVIGLVIIIAMKRKQVRSIFSVA